MKGAPSPRPSPIRWERETIGRVRASSGGPVRFHGSGVLSLGLAPVVVLAESVDFATIRLEAKADGNWPGKAVRASFSIFRMV